MGPNGRLTLLLSFILVLLVGAIYGEYLIYHAVAPVRTVPPVAVTVSPSPTPEVSPSESASPAATLKKVVK